MSIDFVGLALGVGAGLLFLGIYFYFLWRWQNARRAKPIRRVDFDRLDGTAFEEFVADLLTRRGYRVRHTGKSGDLGVDLIAEKAPYRFAVQVKRQAQPVSRHAVSDAVAGKAHYNCNAAMVVTNNTFSQGAHDLAKSNGCKLVDRNVLADWMLEIGN
ncbi:MAG: restriction endonuclease [Chloroflexi bacterium]|nr:restriction endonuclease [Chloroflexota bacterium]